MADLPDPTPELERYIARRLSGLEAAEWKALGKEERQAHVKKARQLLVAERRFLARGSEGGESEAGEV